MEFNCSPSPSWPAVELEHSRQAMTAGASCSMHGVCTLHAATQALALLEPGVGSTQDPALHELGVGGCSVGSHLGQQHHLEAVLDLVVEDLVPVSSLLQGQLVSDHELCVQAALLDALEQIMPVLLHRRLPTCQHTGGVRQAHLLPASWPAQQHAPSVLIQLLLHSTIAWQYTLQSSQRAC